MFFKIVTAFLILFSRNVSAQTVVSFADTVQKVLPSVVSVSAAKIAAEPPEMMLALRGSPFEQFFKDVYRDGGFDMPKSILLGSGFVYDKDGHVITSAHVVENMTEVMVTMNDGTAMTGKVLGRDPKTDLALLKIDAKELTPVVIGSSDAAKIGDPVLAVGNPFGLGNTVTSGIISARSRDIQVGPYDDFIQTDAAINRGNSGGPLFNANGEMIGVNTAIFSPSGGSVGIAFAVPSKMVKTVADALIKDGVVKRGRLGVMVQTVTPEIAKTLGMDKPRGALVAGVDKASPAVKANIRTGDVIIRFDGQDVASMRDLPRMAAETPIGKTVPVVVWREGKEKQVEITVSEMKETSYAGALPNTAPVETVTIRDIPLLGIGVAEITPDLRRKYHLSKNAAGLVVVSVSSKSDAAQKGLKSGDLVVELDKKSVTGFKTLELWEKDAAEMGQESAFVLIERNGERFFAVVRFAPAS
ncbi:MAG: Do family serine endopeptidase [Alphaproteobacteria bacterium]|nr:Do family serine endopeptidase [Alphaproteobacteria bacterium]